MRNSGLPCSKKGLHKVPPYVGVRTNIVTAVEMTEGFSADSPQFAPLVETTAKSFTMQEVSADKAYLSAKNLQVLWTTTRNLTFLSRATARRGSLAENANSRPAIWKEMFHLYNYNSERFMQSYHKRSNVETTFHMIKAKFGMPCEARPRPRRSMRLSVRFCVTIFVASFNPFSNPESNRLLGARVLRLAPRFSFQKRSKPCIK